jgi:hypothetical protein
MRSALKRSRPVKIAAAFILLGIAAYFLIPFGRRHESTVSFLPESQRPAGIRFDPSYFYGRGVTARELARELVPQWKEAGFNEIFFRAYDPSHGASYRTKLAGNTETDYGKGDLLRWVLDEAHGRGMKVHAWLGMLDHAGAWEENPGWRVLGPKGEPHRAANLDHPLCPRQPAVREWWMRFVDDLLDRYPDLDGVDLAEPVLTWRETEGCFCAACKAGFVGQPQEKWCEYRAGPLTDLAIETIRRVRGRGKETTLTTVLPAGVTGDPQPFSLVRDQAGLDLDRVLASPDRPARLSVELMWQEWAGVHASPEVFRPVWAKRAMEEVRRRVAGRCSVLAHLELSDAGALSVRPEDLAAGLAAALEAGADGYEIYDAALFEKKAAWGALDGLASVGTRKKVLVLFHPDDLPDGREAQESSDAWQIATLCGHFSVDAAVKPVASYAAGDGKGMDAVFYLGIADNTTPPEAFLADVEAGGFKTVWLNANIETLLRRSGRFGFTAEKAPNPTAFDAVRYRGVSLPRKEPGLQIVRISDPAAVQVSAEVVSSKETAPYALRSGNLWYFADNPMAFAVEGSSYLVFADLLHDILGENHASKKLAMMRIEDVHPLTPPGDLIAAARLLNRRGVPFLIALVPFYRFPEQDERASLSDQPEFVTAVKEAIRLGATVVLHGATHQRTGESTADYEFWDTSRNGPPADRTDANTRARIYLGLEECIRNGIHPLLWETPHYAAPIADYRIAAQVFTAAVERRQSADRIGTDQLYPYPILKDRFGQLLLPENLGYVPLDDQRPEPILQAAERTAVVRDATACFFFHLFCKLGVLEDIVDGLIERGFAFPDVRRLPLAVSGPGFAWGTMSAPFPKEPPGKEGLIVDASGETVWQGAPAALPRDQRVLKGMRLFLPADEGILRAEEGEEGEERPGVEGDEAFTTRPLAVGILASKEEAPAIEAPFRAFAAPCRVIDTADEMAPIPRWLTLLVASEQAAASMGSALRDRLQSHVEAGGSLLTWGRTPLADQLGIRFSGDERQAAEATDRNFRSTVPLPEPLRIAPPSFGEDGEVLVETKDGTPLLGAVPLGKGKVFYSAVPPFVPGGDGPYPYLLPALRSQASLAPACRAKRLEVYYDQSNHDDDDSGRIPERVKGWARDGVRVVHAGLWHQYESGWTFPYERLILEAHQNAMLVYAWVPFPEVSVKFHFDHPEWREKDRKGADAKMGWRKEAMSLLDPDCREAAKRWLTEMLGKFDFDGVTLAGLSFEGESLEKPDTLTPFSEAARKDFAEKGGFDPRSLWDEAGRPARPEADLKTFLAWRKAWTTRLHREFLEHIAGLYAPRPRALVVAVPDGIASPAEADLAGVDVREVLAIRKDRPFRVLIEDAGDARPWSGERFGGILRDYGGLVDPKDLIFQVDVSRRAKGLRSGSLSGIPLALLLASAGQRPVAIYSEDSILDADWPFLASALAHGAQADFGSDPIPVASPDGFRLSMETGKDKVTIIDGMPWLASGIGEILIPPGERKVSLARVEKDAGKPAAKVVDASCSVLETTAVPRGIRIVYQSDERAYILLSRGADDVKIDGLQTEGTLEPGERGSALACPPGRHEIVALTQSWSHFAIRMGSIALSVGIVILSGLALGLVAFLFLWNRMSSRNGKGRRNGNGNRNGTRNGARGTAQAAKG